MAKLNWKKLQYQSIIKKTGKKDKQDRQRKGDFYIFVKNNLWALKGKYYGVPLNKLPDNYLYWVIKNLEGLFSDMATNEIVRRKAKSAQKVGRPD